MDRKKLEELGIDVTVIAQTIAEKPNEVKQILDMFDTYITKTAIFQEYLKAPRNDIQTVGEQLSQFLETVKWRFVEHWCQVEETINVVQHLEEEIQNTENVFMQPDFYEKYASQTNQLREKIDELKEKVKQKYDRWEELENIKNNAG